ncbi:uncharacterized protein LOC133312081 [Gastrolobium bilobum]|uniref:uncharacterized protein LOC133312081 n=1 Tax=Gastrolobium bilobum TaxID=150636 RepID=UPI002AB18EFA|nr:uncharacterized protein LOC133312081 [Gastrolobium bilobum]
MPNQCSFVKGRHSSDNIVFAQEIFHSMGIKKGWMAIKVDLEKVYDRLGWDFIKDTLQDIQLPEDLINLIMKCISTASMNVLWNGATTREFNPSRGVRQGDPISSYLFVLCIERELSNELGFSLTGDLGKYLGVNLHHKRVTKGSFSHIIERVNRKMGAWKRRSLSLAGRNVLAQSVLSALPMYDMQTNLLPLGICDSMEKITRGFLWNSGGSGNSPHNATWPKVWPEIKKHTRIMVRNGEDTKFWLDNWLPDMGCIKDVVDVDILDHMIQGKVAEFVT